MIGMDWSVSPDRSVIILKRGDKVVGEAATFEDAVAMLCDKVTELEARIRELTVSRPANTAPKDPDHAFVVFNARILPAIRVRPRLLAKWCKACERFEIVTDNREIEFESWLPLPSAEEGK